MKKITLTLLLLSAIYVLSAQSPAEVMAQKITVKMKDSLSLTETQQQNIYSINLQLHQLKSQAWQQYNNHDSLRVVVQRIENTRDSLYHGVLNDEKYTLYLQKKRVLVSNN